MVPVQPDRPERYPTMEPTSDPSTLWLSIAREAFAQEHSAAQAAAALERLGHQRGLGGGFALGLRELISYAGAAPDPTQGALDAELEAVAVSRRIVRPVFEARLQAGLDELDRQMRGKCSCGKCGRVMQSEGRPKRSWGSLLGGLLLKRRQAECQECGRHEFPAQRAIGLSDGDFTPRLEEAVTMIAATVPYGLAVKLIASLCGVEVSVKGIEQMVERRAECVLQLDEQQAGACNPFDDKGLPVAEQVRPQDAVEPSATPQVAYMELDGVVPVTREELDDEQLTEQDKQRREQAKQDKARGGKGRRYRIVGREVKNAVLYDGKDCVQESAERGSILSKSYVSHLGAWLPFALLLWTAMLRLRFDQSRLLVILSDGAEWIRSIAQWLPIETLLILDLYHVKHRLWEVAHALYAEHSARASEWAHVQCARVEQGQARQVVQALRFLHPSGAQAQEKLQELIKYLENNLDRMDYPSYRARGLRVSSGTVESANFHVTGARLKLQGMRWNADGAAQMAALRADLFNGAWGRRTREILAA